MKTYLMVMTAIGLAIALCVLVFAPLLPPIPEEGDEHGREIF